ncbi:MAG: carboxypeptidase-like regulatory domain-containing protein, partial [Muribaculaceae bacterium]|nr:carboxypeptidase-like regulatory domain-containing protein [Muribaculaceae bacterium]
MSIAAVGQLPDAKVNADGFFLKGIVRDSVTAEALPRASVVALPSDRRVVGDTRGIFGIALQATDTAIRVSSVGYRPIVLPVKRNSYNLVVAYLSPSSTELEELVVSKGKYSKKNNPAVDFVKKLRKQSDIGDPYGHDYYSYDKYERITLALNDFDPNADNIILRSYPFLKEYVDT